MKDDPFIPESLRGELSSMYSAVPGASRDVDQSILNRARARMAGRRRLRVLLRVGGAAAAVLIITAILLPVFSTTDRGMYRTRLISNNKQLAGDVSGDG